MTPIMLKRNEFVISLGEGMKSVRLENPHKDGEYETFDHVALKELINKAIKSIENEAPLDDKNIDDAPISETKSTHSKTHVFLMELKASYDKAEEILLKAGGDVRITNIGEYKIVCKILAMLQEEVREPYSEDIKA